MTRPIVLAVWAVIALGVVVCVALPVVTKGRLATLFAFARSLTRTRFGLVLTFVGWLWVGWHLFAR